MSNILSIQSAVAYGHVGNSAAVFPLQRIGHEVWPVYTVNYSNHTGYGAWGGPIIPADDVAAVLAGVKDRDAFPLIDGILTGYQASPEIADVIVGTVRDIKAENPDAIYTCDPVMGSATSGCFVADTIPPLFRSTIVPTADIITPNQFELGYLTDKPVETLEQTLDAVRAAQEIGPQTVLVTSVKHPEDAGKIQMLAVNGDEKYLVTTPFIDTHRNGTGDVTAALFTGHFVDTGDVKAALERTASSVFSLLETTEASGYRELQLVAAQEYFAQPRMQFTAEKL